jgi:DNA-binding CsgD family transcriptional regulator
MNETAVLRGRTRELAAVDDALRAGREGRGQVLIVEGRAGQGKSRLLAEAVEHALPLGFRVASAVAAHSDRVLPFAPLRTALSDPVDPVVPPSAMRDLSTQFEDRPALFAELESLLEQSATGRPLLIALDDLQWADAATIAALGVLPSATAGAPLVWLLAARTEEAAPSLEDTFSALVAGGAHRLRLRPLDGEAVAAIVADTIGGRPTPDLLALAASAGGNPFRLGELLAGKPPRERLAQLSPRARDAATIAALLGRRFTFERLAAAVGEPPSRLLAPTEELIAEGILVDLGQGLGFGHDLVRDAVLDSEPDAPRRARQRALVDRLLAAGVTPLSLAVQLLECAEPGDEAAAAILLDATRELGASDPRSAADMSARTLALLDDDSPLRGPLVAETGQQLHAAGRIEECRVFTSSALRSGLAPPQDAEVRVVVSGMLSLPPDIRIDVGRRALELPGLDDLVRARLLARLMHNLVISGRVAEAADLADAVHAAAARVDDPTVELALWLVEAALAYSDDRFAAALGYVRSARRAAGIGELSRAQLADQWLAEALTGLDETEEAERVSTEGLDGAYADGQAFAVRTWEAWEGRRLLQGGRLADAGAALQGLFGPDATLEEGNIAAGTALVAFGRVALHTGDRRLTARVARIAEEMFQTGTPESRRHMALLLALQAMARDDPAGARAQFARLGVDGRESLLPRLAKDVTDETQLARIARRTGDEELGRRARDAADRRERQNPDVITIAATAAHVRGLLSGDDRDLERATELFARSPRPLAWASALEDRGRGLIRAGRGEVAVTELGRALELYARAGASWDAARVRGRLRALGVRRRLVAPVRPMSGWAALTQAEVRIARLVAEGMTNREVAARLFLSPHTVSMHLRHTYAKLDVHSRLELAGVVRQQPG